MSQAEIPDASHSVVIRSAASFRRDPSDDLVGVHDVAGLAVHAVGRIQMDGLSARRTCLFFHLINIGRTEVLAGVAILHHAARVANISVMNNEMAGLILFMP